MASSWAPLSRISSASRSACCERRSPARRPSDSRSRLCAAMNSRAMLSSALTVVSRASSSPASDAIFAVLSAKLSACAAACRPGRCASNQTIPSTATGPDHSSIQPSHCAGDPPVASAEAFAQTNNPVHPASARPASAGARKARRAWRGWGSYSARSSADGGGAGAAIGAASASGARLSPWASIGTKRELPVISRHLRSR